MEKKQFSIKINAYVKCSLFTHLAQESTEIWYTRSITIDLSGYSQYVCINTIDNYILTSHVNDFQIIVHGLCQGEQLQDLLEKKWRNFGLERDIGMQLKAHFHTSK